MRMRKILSPNETIAELHGEALAHITTLSGMVRGQLDADTRTKIENLVINRVHARDLLKKFSEASYDKINDFLWKIHLKYFVKVASWDPHAGLPPDKRKERPAWVEPPP